MLVWKLAMLGLKSENAIKCKYRDCKDEMVERFQLVVKYSYPVCFGRVLFEKCSRN